METHADERYIQIPLNAHGLHEFLAEDTMDDIRTFIFTTEEIQLLMPLLQKFNEEFQLLIDLYESEFLQPENVLRALEMAREFAAEDSLINLYQAKKRLVEAMELAHQCQTPVIFDF